MTKAKPKTEAPLILFNGRTYCCRKWEDKRWACVREAEHAYVAAYSLTDARRVINEYTGREFATYGELKNYWNRGTWGINMKDVIPERGLWVIFRYGSQPVRLA